MTELTFLVDLLLNHKLSKPTRDAVAARIKEVEGKIVPTPLQFGTPNATFSLPAPQRPRRPVNAQSPSTQAILAEKFTPEEIEKMEGGEALDVPAANDLPITPPVPVTPMAAQALQQRQAAIMKAVNAGPFGGKPDTGNTSPRKW